MRKSCRAICASCAGSSTGRPAAQCLARENPGEPAACRDQKRRDQPRARRIRAARRQGAAGFRQDLGHVRRRVKEGIYEDFERRDALLKLARFKTTASADEWRSLKDYVAALKPNQTAIYYLAGDDIARLKSSPHLEGFRARGIEVLLLPDPVDTFWVMPGLGFDGKPFKSVTQGAADLALIPLLDATKEHAGADIAESVKQFSRLRARRRWARPSREVRASDRLTDSAVCLVAPDSGPDRALERILAGAGRLPSASKPILEVNPQHELVVALAALGDGDRAFKEDAAHLLFDEARLRDGDRPADARLFSDRLARVLGRGLRQPPGDGLVSADYSAGVRHLWPRSAPRSVSICGCQRRFDRRFRAAQPEINLRADQDHAHRRRRRR